jgi:DNA-binding SARP family transcriptional activator
MTLHSLVDHSYQTFLEQLDEARIVLLHPRSRYRSLLIAKLMNDPELNTFYYAMGPDDINLQAFISSITHDLANQYPMFGRHINMLPQKVYENPEENFEQVLKTFAKDLTEITDEPFLLVLDEYDRSHSSDDVQRFVENLSSHLPENCRLVLNGRTLPRLPWVAMIAEKRAVMLEDDKIITHDFYEMGEYDRHDLEVYALGPGFVITEGETINSWEGHLPRLLFFFALDRPVVTRSEICQAFWPDLDSDQAVNVFHVTKRRLHKALDIDVLVHDNGYYRINDDMPIYYDVMEFVASLMKGRTSDDMDTKMQAWQRATEVYRGPFLHGHSDPWIDKRRAEFLAGYLEALTNMADVHMDNDRNEQALDLLLKALEADISRQDLHLQVMRLYDSLGRPGEAVAHYNKTLEAFKEADISPSSELKSTFRKMSA